MNYSVFIYETPADFAKRSDPKIMDAYFGTWMKYFQTLGEAGIMRGGSGLLPPDTATTVRLRQGQRLVEDGPYADTKEQLGGFYMIEVPDLDTALDWAAKCPAAATGALEIRPNLPPMAK
ncbi:MAG TPA: YciI family protein [Dongiaceae bacterium]